MKLGRQPQAVVLRSRALLRRREAWLLLGVSVAIGIVVWLLTEPMVLFLLQVERARTWILDFGALAPVAYMVLFSAQILIAPLPGQFMGVMGGYLFGVGWGSLYSILGLIVGATLAIVLARRFGRPLLEKFFAEDELHRWEKKLNVRSPLTWWLIFLFPVPDITFYIAGLTTVPLRMLLISVLAGRGLGLIFANVMGHWTAQMPPEWVLVKWAFLAALGVLAYLYQRRIRLITLRTVRRWRRWVRHYWTPVDEGVVEGIGGRASTRPAPTISED